MIKRERIVITDNTEILPTPLTRKMSNTQICERLLDYHDNIYRCLQTLRIDHTLVDITLTCKSLYITLVPYLRLRTLSNCTTIILHTNRNMYVTMQLVNSDHTQEIVDCTTDTVFTRFLIEHITTTHRHRQVRSRCTSCLF